MTKDEKKKKQALDRVIRQSFNYHKRETLKRNKEVIDNQMDWIKNNLSPTGGKVAFRKTQKEQMSKKPRSGWLSKNEY